MTIIINLMGSLSSLSSSFQELFFLPVHLAVPCVYFNSYTGNAMQLYAHANDRVYIAPAVLDVIINFRERWYQQASDAVNEVLDLGKPGLQSRLQQFFSFFVSLCTVCLHIAYSLYLFLYIQHLSMYIDIECWGVLGYHIHM
jgi:hypothetical protein